MKGGFSGITKKKKVPSNDAIEAFANDAKVDGDNSVSKAEPAPEPKAEFDPNARRGKKFKNKEGEIVKLMGKVQEIPLNEYEVHILEEAAKRSSLSLTTYIRSVAMNKAIGNLDG